MSKGPTSSNPPTSNGQTGKADDVETKKQKRPRVHKQQSKQAPDGQGPRLYLFIYFNFPNTAISLTKFRNSKEGAY